MNPPELLLGLGLRQQAGDVARAELVVVRHMARDPLAPGYAIVVNAPGPFWAETLRWLQDYVDNHFRSGKGGFERLRGSTVTQARRVVFMRTEDDDWRVEVSTEQNDPKGIVRMVPVLRATVPTDLFFQTWSRIVRDKSTAK